MCGHGLTCLSGCVLWRRYPLIMLVIVVGHFWLVTCNGCTTLRGIDRFVFTFVNVWNCFHPFRPIPPCSVDRLLISIAQLYVWASTFSMHHLCLQSTTQAPSTHQQEVVRETDTIREEAQKGSTGETVRSCVSISL